MILILLKPRPQTRKNVRLRNYCRRLGCSGRTPSTDRRGGCRNYSGRVRGACRCYRDQSYPEL